MSKLKRGRAIDAVDANDDNTSDGGFAEEGNESRQTKKSKTAKALSKDSETDEPIWELSSSSRATRRVTISMLGKTRLVNIREYYEKDGQFLPGKKGISLTIEQYNKLLEAIPDINVTLKSLGEGVGASAVGATDIRNNGLVSAKTVKEKSSKTNIEATSDEDED